MAESAGARSPGKGQIVTFYSFKGGTGRTMALANVAWILAANGMRVLIADWDLESPGLHRFFQPFMTRDVGELPGVIDFIRAFEWASVEAPEEAIDEVIAQRVAMLEDYAVAVDWRFPENGGIDFLAPGKLDNGVYANTLSALEWDTFYKQLYGARFLDALRDHLKRRYDYVLIDSRTGLSDIADICTLHLPDMVVDCFTLSTQGIEGAARVARQIHKFTGRGITVLPVPMRIDHSQERQVAEGMDFAERQFAALPAGMSAADRRKLWDEVEVPYRPRYAYEETLAVFGDRAGAADTLLSSYERLTARVTDQAVTRLPPRQEWLRLRTWRKFSRAPSQNPPEVVIDFSPQDQLWAEWVAAVLASGGLSARLVGEQVGGLVETSEPALVAAIVSDSYLARLEDSGRGSEPMTAPEMVIAVADTHLSSDLLDGAPAVSLVGLSEGEAVDRLIERFEGVQPSERESVTGAMRYPADNRDQIDNLLTRNFNFSGRDDVLRQLREELRSRGRAVVLQRQNIKGIGGVGKTQVALEYAHRFKDDYDVVWWLNCGGPQYVDASLFDLGRRLREVFGASVPEEGSVQAVARQVLQLLGEREAGRWLLIYDNAEDVEAIKPLLPPGGGHVLITSRDERWEGESPQTKTLRLGYFERRESISHLRRRLPNIAEADADKLAAKLGDMPIAVAAAGALLASEKIPVDRYLQMLEGEPVRPLSEGHELSAYPEAVAKAWHLSLDQLQRNSPAAARLLGICSVMVPEIGFDLILSDTMVSLLRGLDRDITEIAMINRLVKQIDLLALIKVENTSRQIVVHRLVQTVVRERMSTTELAAARRDVHQLLVAARPKGDVDDPRQWRAYRQIWPHLRPSEAELSDNEQIRDLLVDRVRYLRQRDDLNPGRRRALTIQDAWIKMLAEQAEPAIAQPLRKQLYRLQFNLANILRDLGEIDNSMNLDRAVLAGQRELLGPEHPHTLATRSSLAADLRALGDYQRALELDQETYESWSQNSGFGEDYAGTLSAANNLALSTLLNGDYRDALRRDRQTLARRVSLYASPGHPRALDSGIAVARDLLEAGRYREAVRMTSDVVTHSMDTLGADARITLNARLWLGIAQRCAGDLDQAAANIDVAMSGLSLGFGDDSNVTLASRLSRALNQLARGHLQDGRRGLGEVLSLYEERLKPDHPNVLICRLNVATALCLEGSFGAAGTQAERAASGLGARLGSGHPYTLAANLVLGSVLANLGSADRAVVLEEMVLIERTRVLGSQHPDTLRCRANLLLTKRELGDNGLQAERQKVVAELAELLGAEHPDVTAASNNRRLFAVINPQPF